MAEIAVSEYVEGIYKQEVFTLKSEIAGAEAAIQKAEDRLQRTQRTRQRMTEVAQGAARTPADIVAELDIVDRLEDAEERLQHEKKSLELARAKLNVLEKYTRDKTTKALKLEAGHRATEETARKEAWMLEQNKTTRLKKQIEACQIVAPRFGSVVYANDSMRRPGGRQSSQIEEGALVRERQKIASVVDKHGPMQVSLKVAESKVDLVRAGQAVTIRPDALPELTLTGLVESVAPLPDASSMAAWDNKVYATRVRFEQETPALRPGMTTHGVIHAADLENVLAVPNAAIVHFDGASRLAIQRADGSFEWHTVVPGATTDTVTVIRSGLKAGELVGLEPRMLLTASQQRQDAGQSVAPQGGNGASRRQPPGPQ